MLQNVGGVFVKIAFASDVSSALAQGMPHRPAARFNRRGQDALYLSPDEASARVAIGEYVKPGDAPRVLLRFELAPCQLFDLRHETAAAVYANARQPWQGAVARGQEPASWTASEDLRRAGYVGLIDPSRQQPGLWHITLFGWNRGGAPRIWPIGAPQPIVIAPKS
jgi:RES domain-containing protein